jgi:hypothetical protein
MSSAQLTVYIKNMAGDLQSVEMPNGSYMEDLMKRLSELDIKQYPLGRTHVFRADNEKVEGKEEAKLLEDGEMVSVFVSEIQKEAGIFREDVDVRVPELRKGEPYMRFTIPLRGRKVYVYALSCAIERSPDTERQQYYLVSWYSDPCEKWWPIYKPGFPPTISYLDGYVLYGLFYAMLDNRVTPEEMKMIYDIVLPYYEEQSRETGIEYNYSVINEERILCDCGSVVKRSSLKSHYKTKKHQAYANSQ